jgi:hypothetical protein
MLNTRFALVKTGLASVTLFAAAAIGLAEDPAHAQSREQREDSRACTSFGLDHGSHGYSRCMEELGRRRDSDRMSTLEEMAITSQIAKDGQIMAERARRQRCDRNPERRECRRN